MPRTDSQPNVVLDAVIRRTGGTVQNVKSAAASAAHPTVSCRRCEQANPSGRRFCGGCGQSLWETCPRCKAECSADERFCGSCGTDILGGLSQQSRELDAKLDQAQELLAALRYDAAISCLRGVAAVSDPRFDKWAQTALTQIARVEELRLAQDGSSQDALARGRQHLEIHNYEAASAALEEIPAPLRGAEASSLLGRAQSAREELAALSGQIRAGLEAKRPTELLPKIARLLTLKPGHKQATLIADGLRDGVIRLAKKHLAQHKYREALDQLDQVPALLSTAEVDSVADTAGELLALLDGAKQAVLADRATLALAERLVKLAPANEEAASLRTQLAQRVQTRPTDPRGGAPHWAPIPKQTPLGVPVDWLAHVTRVPAADAALESTLHAHPGQFLVALGLALQGIGLAAVPIDLSPSDRGGLLGRLPSFTLGRSADKAAWGLDLSDHALKAIKLVQDPQGGAPRIAACQHIARERTGTVEAVLQDFLARAGELKSARICASLASQRVLGRFFELPPLAAKKVQAAIAFEAQHQLPVALDELCWASHAFEPAAGKQADEAPRRVMLAAARQSHVRDRVATFKAVGINVDLVQSDCVALHNALVHELPSDQVNGATGVLDVGADSTSVVVSSPAGVWFRTFGQGGDSLTNLLVKQFGLTHQQAEQLKREPAKARRYRQWRDALRPAFVQLASELERSLANYAKLYPHQPVKQICGVGGGFQTHGLLRHLRLGK